MIQDIQSIEAVGGGGLQFLPFYNYGFGHPGFPPWDEFGFGSPKFKDLFTAAMKAARDTGLTFDFSLGANQGQGVPVEPQTPGLAVQLVYSEVTIAGGESFDRDLPEASSLYNFDLSGLARFMHKHEEWGSNKLVAVVAGAVKSSTLSFTTVTTSASHLIFT